MPQTDSNSLRPKLAPSNSKCSGGAGFSTELTAPTYKNNIDNGGQSEHLVRLGRFWTSALRIRGRLVAGSSDSDLFLGSTPPRRITGLGSLLIWAVVCTSAACICSLALPRLLNQPSDYRHVPKRKNKTKRDPDPNCLFWKVGGK